MLLSVHSSSLQHRDRDLGGKGLNGIAVSGSQRLEARPRLRKAAHGFSVGAGQDGLTDHRRHQLVHLFNHPQALASLTATYAGKAQAVSGKGERNKRGPRPYSVNAEAGHDAA